MSHPVMYYGLLQGSNAIKYGSIQNEEFRSVQTTLATCLHSTENTNFIIEVMLEMIKEYFLFLFSCKYTYV